jgi:hypothetical protein
LSRTKSAVLVCDLPQADELLVELFKDFFNLAALGLPTPIEAYMSDIMAALLDECQSVPSDVVDTLIAQFSAKKSVGDTYCGILELTDSVIGLIQSSLLGCRRSMQCVLGQARPTCVSVLHGYNCPAPVL